MKPIQPLSSYVVAVPETSVAKTAGGLYLPDQTKEKSRVARILATGSAVKELKPGDTILYRSEQITDVSVGASDYIAIKEEDVIATIQ